MNNLLFPFSNKPKNLYRPRVAKSVAFASRIRAAGWATTTPSAATVGTRAPSGSRRKEDSWRSWSWRTTPWRSWPHRKTTWLTWTLKTFLSDDIIVDELRETTYSLKNCYMFRVTVFVQKYKNLLDKQLLDYSFHFSILALRH